MKIYNTFTNKIEKFVPLNNNKVKIYSCGPTVYGFAHIGNFRSFIFSDFLRRVFEYLGYDVIQVVNITDVDDKTIKKSKEQNISLSEYTKKYEKAFFEDLESVNIEKAEHYPRATEHINEMVELIKKLLKNGFAYDGEDAIYYDITKFKEYGKLGNIDSKKLKKGVRINVDEYDKENIRDFALWKKRKKDEPFWETDIGDGRPGWHIECSAMSMKYLGETFDIHTGGEDLIFPHHENEIAQSEAATGKQFVKYWLHVKYLIVEGEKMSKSKGNYFTLRDLLEKGYQPEAIRLLLLSTHYRKTLNFTFESLKQSKNNVQRILNFVLELKTTVFKDIESKQIDKLIKNSKSKFKESLEDDLNISLALSAVFEFIKESNILIKKGLIGKRDAKKILKTIREFDKVLGVLPNKVVKDIPEKFKKLISERDKYRKEKNYKKADEIRNYLKQKGIILEDTPSGVRWKVIDNKK